MCLDGGLLVKYWSNFRIMQDRGKMACGSLINSLPNTLKFKTEYFKMIRGCLKHNKISFLTKSKIFKNLSYVVPAKIENRRAIYFGWTEFHQNWYGNSVDP